MCSGHLKTAAATAGATVPAGNQPALHVLSSQVVKANPTNPGAPVLRLFVFVMSVLPQHGRNKPERCMSGYISHAAI
ncbi:hypothetical protein [Paraburkholderia hospita]|uniref:hypothetical protein n=1 Tax=Paraburkholderia hospita TaxID=169430 RepID=UPI000B342DA5|nr:hypothetical protein [Paraburkholderia hospita]OUL90544.1 hypothetical protein CA601_15305 [Paraburkholderia hospita]OUL96504.1 hypothetical protein CA603_05165 [Paraburkholderia hospita]